MRLPKRPIRRIAPAWILLVGTLFVASVTGLALGGSTPPVAGNSSSVYLFTPFYYHLCVSINAVATGENGTPAWHWGDGTVSKGPPPQNHTYSTVGKYHLVVKWGTGKATRTLDVTDVANGTPPRLTLFTPTVTGLNVSVNGVVTMDTCGPLHIGELHWTWGDGTSSYSNFLGMHTYSSPGMYTICAKATDSLGLHTKKCVTATV